MSKKLRMFNNTGKNGLVIAIVILLLGASAAACDSTAGEITIVDWKVDRVAASPIVDSISAVHSLPPLLERADRPPAPPSFIVRVDTSFRVNSITYCAVLWWSSGCSCIQDADTTFFYDTIRAPKIQGWFTPNEWKDLQDMLHPAVKNPMEVNIYYKGFND